MTNVSAADRRAADKARDPVAAREKLAIKALFGRALEEAARDPAAMAARGQIAAVLDIPALLQSAYILPLCASNQSINQSKL
jgi:hypothetical protein